MSGPSRSSYLHFIFAFLAPAVIALLMSITWPLFVDNPVSIYLLAVIVSAWYGGLWPGLTSLIVSLLITNFLFIEPYLGFGWPGKANGLRLVVTAIVGVFISLVCESLRQERGTAEKQTAEVKRIGILARDSESKLADVIDSAMDAIITIDPAQRIVLFNTTAEKMFLCTAGEAIGRSIEDFIPERFRSGHSAHVRRFGEAHATNRSMGSLGAIYGMRSNSEEFPIEASISQVEVHGEKTFTVILRDITERKLVEEALQRSERKYHRLFDSMTEGFAVHELVFDEEGKPCDSRFLDLNPAWEEQTGVPRKPMIGKTMKEAWPKIASYWLDVFSKVALTGEQIRCENLNNELERWYETFVFSTGPNQVATLFFDITERKEAENNRQELNETLELRVGQRTEQLEAVNKDLESFSYSVSHDLRAPLRHIDGFVQLLASREGERLEPTSRHYLDVISTSVGRMGRLIDELLAFSRTGRQEIRTTRVDMNRLVKQSRQILAPVTGGRSIEWIIGTLPAVEGDSVLLELVITNMLSNAIKYSSKSDKAKIEIGALNGAGEQATIFVRDNGAGFDMRYADKLFGVFQRLHRENEFEGIGIGLATARKIINRHGGRIWAEAESGKGACFYFTITKASEKNGEMDDA